MKLRNLFITLGLSLTVASAGIIIGSGLNAKEPVKAEAFSIPEGTVKVTAANLSSFIGGTAYVICSDPGYGAITPGGGESWNGGFGRTGSPLAMTIAEETNGNAIYLIRNDNGKYLNDPLMGTWSDSPVAKYLDSGNSDRLAANSELTQHYYSYRLETTCFDKGPSEQSNKKGDFYVYATPVPTKLELKVNDGWASDGARFAAYFFEAADSQNHNTWVDMTLVSGSTKLYEVVAPDGYDMVIFCRMKGDQLANNWDNALNQSDDLTIADGNYFLCKDGGWDKSGLGGWHDGEDNVYVKGTFSETAWAKLEDCKMSWNRLSGQYELKSFDKMSATNAFKVNDETRSAWAGFVAEGMTNDGTLFTAGEGGNIVCSKTTTYDIYYKPYNNAIWIEEDAVVAATNFSTTFLTTTNGICVDSSKTSGDTNVSALAAVWNAKATPDGTSLVEKWNALSDGAKGTFVEGDANETIEDAHDRYVHIMGRYSNTLTPFTDGPQYSAINVHSILGEQSNSGSNITIIIVIASASILAVAGVFFLRRKHEN